MIKIIDDSGRTHFVAPEAISKVAEAAASSQWHGIRSYVKTFDGETIESQLSAADIALAVENALAARMCK